MKRKALILGFAAVATVISTLAFSEGRYKVLTDDDVGFCYKMAYYHMKDARNMIPVRVYQEGFTDRNLRIFHKDGNDKWVTSEVSCNFHLPLDDIPTHERIFGVAINGEQIDTSDMIDAREMIRR
ncbi:hypothetical protein [Halomonas sp. BMC6]|uniref:hypothetical protein n=1 Tax=Halomonas sp. BMC6 TaxID=3073244 RepID=UPI0030CAD017